MKVYVVTTGCYSDYGIDKVFTDRQKAEEYKEWLRDANEIEEYETEDDLQINKFYRVKLEVTIYPDGQRGPNVFIAKTTDRWDVNYYSDYGSYFKLAIGRTVEAQNWNEEFYVNRYKKALYDLIAVVKDLRLQKYSQFQINQMLSKYEVSTDE